MTPKITLPWVKVLDDYSGGLQCIRCGGTDHGYKFPNSPGANMKAARDFQEKHKDCKKTGPVWECVNPVCPVKSDKCKTETEPKNKSGICRRAQNDGQKFYMIYKEVLSQ